MDADVISDKLSSLKMKGKNKADFHVFFQYSKRVSKTECLVSRTFQFPVDPSNCLLVQSFLCFPTHHCMVQSPPFFFSVSHHPLG